MVPFETSPVMSRMVELGGGIPDIRTLQSIGVREATNVQAGPPMGPQVETAIPAELAPASTRVGGPASMRVGGPASIRTGGPASGNTKDPVLAGRRDAAVAVADVALRAAGDEREREAKQEHAHHVLSVDMMRRSDQPRPAATSRAAMPPQLGHWRHWEFYMRSETRPLYYEYGSFSGHPELLASACPDVMDYSMQFPVVGSDPMRCLAPSDVLDMNSKDGIYVARTDGAIVIDHRSLAWNGRFNRFNFPAYHGGGGWAISNAGWAMDNFCVRAHPPEGFLSE